MLVNTINKLNFSEEFLDKYLERGFGMMSKREIDVLMMHLLYKYADLSEKSNYELSLTLKMTESKIKNLRLESQLHYQSESDNYIKELFFKILQTAKLKIDPTSSNTSTSWIMLSVENTYLKLALESKLKGIGSFADYSFNKEILKIEKDDFIDLLATFYTDAELKNFVDKTKKMISKKDEVDFKKLMNIFLESIVKETGKQTVDIGVNFLTGGASGILTLAHKMILSAFK